MFYWIYYLKLICGIKNTLKILLSIWKIVIILINKNYKCYLKLFINIIKNIPVYNKWPTKLNDLQLYLFKQYYQIILILIYI